MEIRGYKCKTCGAEATRNIYETDINSSIKEEVFPCIFTDCEGSMGLNYKMSILWETELRDLGFTRETDNRP